MQKQNLLKVLVSCLLVLGLVTDVWGEESFIRILHVNDFHGFAEPYKPSDSQVRLGGVAYLATEINRLRSERPSLLLSAGDMIQGNTWANFSQGKSVIELMNTMKFDAMATGNHEFDFGQDALKQRISEASFPVIAANVVGMKEVKAYLVKKVAGIKVGILGVVAEDTPVLTKASNVTGLTFTPVQQTIERYLPEIRKECDIVILLSHMGYAADRLIAETVKGIDIIIGGHSHTKITDPTLIGNALVAQAWEHGKALGIIDIVFENGRVKKATGHLEEISPENIPADHKIEEIVIKRKQELDAVLNQTIAKTDVDLDGENVRKRETNLGDLIADAMRDVSGADAALINGGAIRTSIRKGEIKMKDIYSVVPFDSYVVAIKLKGRQVWEALEHGFADVEQGAGAFPQVSGLSMRYDLSVPSGARIKEVQIGGTPIDPDKEYTMATLDFIAAGGDGYKAFGDAIKSSKDYSVVGGAMRGENVVYSDPGKWLRDLVIEYFKSHHEVNPHVNGRMVQIQKP